MIPTDVDPHGPGDLALSIEPEDSPAADHVLALLEEANIERHHPRAGQRFCATLRRSDGTVVGGVTAQCFWGWLYIVALAIAPAWRGRSRGRELLAAAEAWGVEAGARSAWLMTMSFQARGFYERAGYAVFAELDDFPPGHSRLFMRKALDVRAR